MSFKENFRLSGSKPAAVSIQSSECNSQWDTLKIVLIALIISGAAFVAAHYTKQDKGLVALIAFSAFAMIVTRKARMTPWGELIFNVVFVYAFYKIAMWFGFEANYKGFLASFPCWIIVMTILNVEGVVLWKKVACFFPMAFMAQIVVAMAGAPTDGGIQIYQNFTFWLQAIVAPTVLIIVSSLCAQGASHAGKATAAWIKERKAIKTDGF